MSLLGNIIWLIFGGLLAGLGYIIGGLLLGTGLTLYVVPAVYSYLTHELSAEERALHAEEGVATSPAP